MHYNAVQCALSGRYIQLEKLMKKRDEVRQKELLNAFASSNKSFEEVMSFLRGGSPEE